MYSLLVYINKDKTICVVVESTAIRIYCLLYML